MKIGILGGGQLARMLALSAESLGIEVVCIDPNPDCSASKVTNVIHSEFSDLEEIDKYFHDVTCVTYETENLPIQHIETIASKYPIFPSIDALRITQDRLFEKNYLNDLDIKTVDYAPIISWGDIEQAIEKLQFPVVLKTRRSGYDGKGQYVLRTWDEAKVAWEKLAEYPLIIEKFVAYEYEVSIIAVRDQSGSILFYPLILNKHDKGILRISAAPYDDQKLQVLAEKYARKVLEKLNYVGVMTVEFFCVGGALIANEIAPRVHNSGHWTIEGAETSQFENHIRAISGLALGSTKAKGYSRMINLIGIMPDKQAILSIPGAYYHWYDKQVLPQRKLGHVTVCMEDEQALNSNIVTTLNHMLEL